MQTTGSNGGSAEFVPLMVEVFKESRPFSSRNPRKIFTGAPAASSLASFGSVGWRMPSNASEAELHSQYLISYNPNNKDEGGFHKISVEIAGRKDVKVRTRPGYWLGVK